MYAPDALMACVRACVGEFARFDVARGLGAGLDVRGSAVSGWKCDGCLDYFMQCREFGRSISLLRRELVFATLDLQVFFFPMPKRGFDGFLSPIVFRLLSFFFRTTTEKAPFHPVGRVRVCG